MSSYKPVRSLKSPNKSSKYAQKLRTRRIVIGFLSILCLLTIAAAVILAMRSSLFEINKVVVKGTAMLSSQEIEKKALESAPLGSAEIKKNILSDFMGIESVSLSRSWFKTLTITVHERVPAAIVCPGFRDDTASGVAASAGCYASDAHGYVFSTVASTTSALSTNSLTSYYIPTDSGETLLGTHFVEEKRFDELEHLVQGARLGGLSPQGILIEDNGEYEMYVKNQKGDSEVTVYFDDKAPFDATLSNLLTFWQNFPKKKDAKNTTPATTTQSFDYINLRFGNTVYYSTQ